MPDRRARRGRRPVRRGRGRPVEPGHAGRQRHRGDARAPRTAQPGGAHVVRAPRRVPVLRMSTARAQSAPGVSTGQPCPPDLAGRVGRRPLPGRRCAPPGDQRTFHRSVRRRRPRRAPDLARPAVDGAGDIAPGGGRRRPRRRDPALPRSAGIAGAVARAGRGPHRRRRVAGAAGARARGLDGRGRPRGTSTRTRSTSRARRRWGERTPRRPRCRDA